MSWSSRGLLIARRFPRYGPGTGMLSVRHVTDIPYYKELDQSHLHVKQAESFRSTFQKQIEALDKRKEGRVKKDKNAKEEDADTWEEVKVQDYVERGPADMLKLFSRHLSVDPTAAATGFHDDPFLTPYSTMQKMDYLLSKAGGRAAARFVLDRHPHLFTENRIYMEPNIEKFMPRATAAVGTPSEEMLNLLIEGSNVPDAIQVWDHLLAEGTALQEETKQALLELIAFHMDPNMLDEEDYLVLGVETGATSKQRRLRKDWGNEDKAQDVFVTIDPPTPQAREAMLLGYHKHNIKYKAEELLAEMEKAGDVLSLNALNVKLSLLGTDAELSPQELRSKILAILSEIYALGYQPNQETLAFALKMAALRSRGPYTTPAIQLALDLIAEFKTIGIQPSILDLVQLAPLGKFRVPSPFFLTILDELSNRDLVMTDPKDSKALFFLMGMAQRFGDISLVYRVHEITLYGQNARLMNNDGDRYAYYTTFFKSILEHEPFEVSMEWWNNLVPHTLSPTHGIHKDLMRSLMQNKAFPYLPKLWSDLTLSNFCGLRKGGRMELRLDFLKTCLQARQHPSTDLAMKTAFITMAKETLNDVMAEPDGRQLPLDMNEYATEICDIIVQMSLDFAKENDGDTYLARSAFLFCYENSHILISSLLEETVFDFANVVLESGNSELAIKCVIYASNTKMKIAEDLAKTVSESPKVTLTDAEKKQFNQMFSHNTRWQVLN